jgi:hypothetical protein
MPPVPNVLGLQVEISGIQKLFPVASWHNGSMFYSRRCFLQRMEKKGRNEGKSGMREERRIREREGERRRLRN